MSSNEVNIKKKPKQTAIILGDDLYERAQKEADERNMSMSALGRIAYEQLLENGKNEPIVMLQIVDMLEKVKKLHSIIPEKDYKSLQKNLSNIMKIKGGQI